LCGRSESVAHVIELVRVVQGQIRRPAALGVQKADFDLGDEVSFPYELLG